MYRTILLPTNGSELAQTALAEVEHAVDSDSEVIVLQVVDSTAHIFA
jgi:hypothetical protein